MNELVKFVMVSNLIQIENNYSYIEEKVVKFTNNLGIKDYIIDELELSEITSLENNTDFYLEFNYDNNEYFIHFRFGTYNGLKQLEISINSNMNDDNLNKYTISSKISFLEQLKITIKDSFIYSGSNKKEKDWDRCIWLKDKQSEIYASNLYPKIYKAENLFRELINSAMVKIFGFNWWNDVLPKNMIKKKDSSKSKEYKDIVSSLKDVDETLMCVNVSDLINILQLKSFKLEFEKDLLIEQNLIMLKDYIGNTKIPNMEKEQIKGINYILNKLISQLKESSNLWDMYFLKYLNDDFLNNIRKFNKNRNHIAHNKLVDRQAYESINNNIDLICSDLDGAISKFNDSYKSLEFIELTTKENDIYYEEIMEAESGVEIRNKEEISEIFEEVISKLHEEVSDGLRFRTDIEVDKLNKYSVLECSEQFLFRAHSLVTKEEIDINCNINLEDGQGEISELNIKVKYKNEDLNDYKINYVNGAVSYNSEQCTYMPETIDGLYEGELENSISSIIEIIDDNLENIREEIDRDMYRIVKDGGKSPVADSICCWNCGEEYICVDENYGDIGQCLNCGEYTAVIECESCGSYVEELTWLGVCECCVPKDFYED